MKQNYAFLFSELVKRDFKKKYKRSVLGIAWSILSPLLTLLVMRLVFTRFFGRDSEHYTTYLFCGNIVFSYFNESVTQGMGALMSNASIFTKINLPKFLFVLSSNTRSLLNFLLTLPVFFLFCFFDGIAFKPSIISLAFPILFLCVFCAGISLLLSSLFVFFRDIGYLWGIFSQLLMYLSAIFYSVEAYPPFVKSLFNLNPVYLFISYFRSAVIDGKVPSLSIHALISAFSSLFILIGYAVYRKCDEKFAYYV